MYDTRIVNITQNNKSPGKLILAFSGRITNKKRDDKKTKSIKKPYNNVYQDHKEEYLFYFSRL